MARQVGCGVSNYDDKISKILSKNWTFKVNFHHFEFFKSNFVFRILDWLVVHNLVVKVILFPNIVLNFCRPSSMSIYKKNEKKNHSTDFVTPSWRLHNILLKGNPYISCLCCWCKDFWSNTFFFVYWNWIYFVSLCR